MNSHQLQYRTGCWYTEFPDSDSAQQNIDWSIAATKYANVVEMPHFVAQHCQHYVPQATGKTADPLRLQGKQFVAYRIVWQPLRMIVSGTAGNTWLNAWDFSLEILWE